MIELYCSKFKECGLYHTLSPYDHTVLANNYGSLKTSRYTLLFYQLICRGVCLSDIEDYCEIFIPEMHFLCVQVQLVSFKLFLNSLIFSDNGWHLRSSSIRHRGLHVIIFFPSIWWHWHLFEQSDVIMDWLA